MVARMNSGQQHDAVTGWAGRSRPISFFAGLLAALLAVLLTGEVLARLAMPKDIREQLQGAAQPQRWYKPDPLIGADFRSYEDLQARPAGFTEADDWDKAFAGGSADPALWTLLAAYAVATYAARLLTERQPLPEAIARLDAWALTSGVVWGGAIGLFALALLLSPGTQVQPFIYFQF
jgi:hypothetical protein